MRKEPYQMFSSKIAQQVNLYTYLAKFPQWMDNLAENMSAIRSGKDIKDLPRHEGKPAIIVGAGPSVEKYKQLDSLSRWLWLLRPDDGILIACDKALKPIHATGVVPDLVISTDGDPQVAKFYGDMSGYWAKAVFNALSVHPDTVKACPFPIFWYQSIIDDPRQPNSITRAVHYMTKKTMLQSLGNVGGMAWHIALYLGCNPIGIMGLDYGYPADTHIEETIYYKAYLKLAKEDAAKAKQFFHLVKNEDTGKTILSDMNWDAYRRIFLQYAAKAPVETVNLSPESSIYGENIKTQSLEEFLRK